jgi:hypothetical protein
MKNTIIGIVIGVCVAVTGFHVWFYYNVAKQTATNTQAIAEIVTFINKGLEQQKAQTPGAPTVTK